MKSGLVSLRTHFVAVGDHILSATSFAQAVLTERQATVRQHLQFFPFGTRPEVALLQVDLGDPEQPTDAPIPAFVNHGRWLAQCQTCRSAEYVDLDQLLFMCCACWNFDYGCQWRRVLLPKNWKAIEKLLLLRPDPDTRNWEPGERLTLLRADNKAHGHGA